LVHDAQYLDEDMPQKSGWGHSTVVQVLELGRAAEAKQLVLYHHDPERDDAALDAISQSAAHYWLDHRLPGVVRVAHEGLELTL
jgi:ribonuclease BN (tRNA processing enzyme)